MQIIESLLCLQLLIQLFLFFFATVSPYGLILGLLGVLKNKSTAALGLCGVLMPWLYVCRGSCAVK